MDEQPGAHTGTTRKYIPGYSDSNIIFRAPTTGNDANDGLTRLTPKQTKAACDTAAGSTKKIRIVEACTLNESISKPTEMERGVSGTISSSLTDPLASLTAAGTPAWTSGKPERIAWSPKLSKFYGVGSTEIVSSADGNVWALEETLSGVTGRRIWWDEYSQRLFVGCTAGGLLYSSDGSTYTQVTVGTGQINAFAFSAADGLYVIGEGLNIWVSSDALTWEKVYTASSMNSFNAGVYAAGKFVFANSDGELFTSSDGYVWTQTSPFNSYEVAAIAYMENVSLYIAIDVDGEIWSSPDATTWTSRRSATANPCFDIAYIRESGYAVVADSGRALTRSVNGTSWTSTAALAAYASGDRIRGVAYSPLLGRIATVGGNDGGSTRVNARGPAYANTISASIAGFTVQAIQYSGTVKAYNCTMKQPGTTAALSTENCRITEPGAHISNNAQRHFGLLIEGETYFTTTPASQNAFALNCCTVVGRAHIYNASSTYFEQIRDCIFEDGITANFSIAVESGNIRGTCTNVVYGQGIGVSDPKFVDTTDYQLQREVNEYDENSPCVEKASYYFNSNGDRRDMGAWSYTETAEYYIYERAFEFRKPSAKDATTHVERGQSSMYWGEDMTPDVANDPDAQGEELILQYRTLPIDHIECIKYLRQQRDLTVRIDYDPEFEQAGTVTVNGDQSAGAVFLLVDSTTARPGQKVTIGTKVYTIIRMSGTTKLVLDRDTEDAVTDNQVLNLSDTAGKGEFQYNPEQPMNLTRFYENNQEYLKGARMHFARKKP